MLNHFGFLGKPDMGQREFAIDFLHSGSVCENSTGGSSPPKVDKKIFVKNRFGASGEQAEKVIPNILIVIPQEFNRVVFRGPLVCLNSVRFG